MSIVLAALVLVGGFSRLSFAMMCGGSDGHSQHTQVAQSSSSEHGHEAMRDTQPSSKEAMNVGNKICPVSGEKVGQSGMEPANYEYQGKVYNFCCPACIDEFKKNPEKYIQKIKEQEVQAQPEKG
jgi:YHS domain-containing protein